MKKFYAEIKKLSDRSNESINQNLDLFSNQNLGDEDIDIGFDSSIINDTANPAKSYRLYYGTRRLLIDFLPKGKDNERLRKFIYSEKNLFLNRGKEIGDDGIRGSDGRMSYITNSLRVAFNTVTNWIQSGANPYDIYMDFWNLNEENKFHAEKEK